MSEPRRTPGSSGGPPGAELAGIGVQFVAVLLASLYGGRWLDERFGTAPWFLLLGVLLGFSLSLVYIFRRLGAGAKDPREGEK